VGDKQKRKPELKVTTGKYTVLLPLNIDVERLKTQLTYHNAFRQMRPARLKYHLSCNEILELNGIYLYTILVKSEFTYNNIKNFTGYFNNLKTEYYLNNLKDKGYIKVQRVSGRVIYYRLTEQCNDIIEDIFSNYDESFKKFIEKHNISVI